MRPENFAEVEDEALAVNHLTIAELEKAPEAKLVWTQWVSWLQKHNTSKKGVSDIWGAPVPCGYNIIGYDIPITNKYAQKWGPWDDKFGRNKLFHPISKFDIMDHVWFYCENNSDIHSIALTTILAYMGYDKEKIENAHNALVDVKNCWAIGEKLMRMQRWLTTKDETTKKRRLEMKNCFGANKT